MRKKNVNKKSDMMMARELVILEKTLNDFLKYMISFVSGVSFISGVILIHQNNVWKGSLLVFFGILYLIIMSSKIFSYYKQKRKN